MTKDRSESDDPNAVAAASVLFLKLWGIIGGRQVARAALIAQARLNDPESDHDFLRAKLVAARFYAEHVLPQALPLAAEVTRGAQSVLALDPASF